MKISRVSLLAVFVALAGYVTGQPACGNERSSLTEEVFRVLRSSILHEASYALQEIPVTVTSSHCVRSAGGKHDFYSEGDYWWLDPADPGGPYVQRDGVTNPGNFVAHRQAMIRFSRIVASLAAAYVITGDDQYVKQAFKHVHAWFADTATMMNPSLLYAQAIQGRTTGRGIGIIDTIHLIEVAQGIMAMEKSVAADPRTLVLAKDWFSRYLGWLTTHPYGKDEMNAENNHGTCWIMQVASFAKLTSNRMLMDLCRDRYKNVLLPGQMAGNGSFPRELKRTKPYSYSLFNLDAMTTICQILSDETDDLWHYRTPEGGTIGQGIEFLYPYVTNKDSWPYAKDIMYWSDWPVAHPFLVFGALAFNNKHWLRTWKKLNHVPDKEEVLRNLPVRNPVIWLQVGR